MNDLLTTAVRAAGKVTKLKKATPRSTEMIVKFMDRFVEANRCMRRGEAVRLLESALRVREGITAEETDIIRIVSMSPAGCRIGEIVGRLGSDPSNATRTVRSLIAKKLVTKKRAKEDGRGMVVLLTPQGRTVSQHIRERHLQLFELITRVLPIGKEDELLDALEAVNRLFDSIAAEIDAPAVTQVSL